MLFEKIKFLRVTKMMLVFIKSMRFLMIVLICISILLTGCDRQKPQETKIKISTGDITGAYYVTGAAIARMVNMKKGEYNIMVEPFTSAGSVANIDSVLRDSLICGIAQSDRQYQAYMGEAEWQDSGSQSELRSVFSIHQEEVTLLALKELNITAVKDLAGKRVNLGSPGSGHLKNALDVLEAANLDIENNLIPYYYKIDTLLDLLQDDKLDAFFYTVGHPNSNIENIINLADMSVVPINGPEIDSMLAENPYYFKSKIPSTFYYDTLSRDSIETIGVKATLVTSAKMNEDIVYAMTKEVFDNLKAFKESRSLDTLFKDLDKRGMLEGLTAPIHKGAMKYYREIGLDTCIDSSLIAD